MDVICWKCGYKRQASDASSHEALCPQCGTLYAEKPEDKKEKSVKPKPKKEKRVVSDSEKLLALTECNQHKTNHILHLLLSILTAGVWLIVWFIITANNTSKRNVIKKRHGLEKESNAPAVNILTILALVIFVLFKYAAQAETSQSWMIEESVDAMTNKVKLSAFR